MSGQIDENGFPDFTADFDGRMISAAGGQSGRLVLLNGQSLTFPWKTQQELPDTTPATTNVIEFDVGSVHEQEVQIAGANLLVGAQPPIILMSSPYADSTDAFSYIHLRSGIATSAGTSATLTLRSSAGADGTQGLYVNTPTYFADDIEMATSTTLEVAHLNVIGDASNPTHIGSGSGQDIELITGTVSGDLVLTATAGNLTVTAGGLAALSWSSLFGAWTVHTPVVTQGVTVTKTVTRSTYVKLGRTVVGEYDLAITASGTANTIITLSLPVTAAATNMASGLFWWYNGTFFVSNAYLASTTTMAGIIHGTANAMGLTQAGWPNQLLNTHILRGFLIYESAS